MTDEELKRLISRVYMLKKKGKESKAQELSNRVEEELIRRGVWEEQ